MRAEENGSGGTLSGNKKNVYTFLKIMKLMFDISLTSFYLKYAVDRAIGILKDCHEIIKLLIWEI